jgi:DNA-nicking Smr family endonuclease
VLKDKVQRWLAQRSGVIALRRPVARGAALARCPVLRHAAQRR